jgi:protocatechuate 3,4-dioxygenase beta subunit
MLTRIAPLACCAVALVLAGCARGQVTDVMTGQPTVVASSVRGQVTDVTTGQPIVGATVTFRDATGNAGTVATDESGSYSFEGVTTPQPAPGPVTFEVSAPDYFTLTVERDLQYDDNEEHTWGLENFLLVLGCG